MRWFWIDKFTELVSGSHATAIKNVALAEEQVHDHFPGWPIMPNSLILEGLAQTGGLLVAEHSGFQERVILAKVARVQFHFPAVPGHTLTYRARIEDIGAAGAMTSTTSHVGERLQAEADIFFAHVSSEIAGEDLFAPADYYHTLKILQLFHVGVKPDGTPIDIPPKFQSLAAADRW